MIRSKIETPFFWSKFWTYMWYVFSRRLIRAVKHIKAEFRMFQFSDLNSSMESIIAFATNWEASALKNESLKTNFIMFNEWIFVSSRPSAFYIWDSKKDRVLFKSKVSVVLNSVTPLFWLYDRFALIIAGSALKIAMIVGGIPADLLNTVLWFSIEILSNVFWSICMGKSE